MIHHFVLYYVYFMSPEYINSTKRCPVVGSLTTIFGKVEKEIINANEF